VRLEPRTTNTFSVFIRNRKRNWTLPRWQAAKRQFLQNFDRRVASHYDDILEKRHGEWRILQRKMGMNEK